MVLLIPFLMVVTLAWEMANDTKWKVDSVNTTIVISKILDIIFLIALVMVIALVEVIANNLFGSLVKVDADVLK